MAEPDTPVTVRKLGYDGSVLWEIPGLLTKRLGNLLVVHHPIGTPVYSDGAIAWTVSSAPLVHYLWTDRWYSVYDGVNRRGVRQWYGNVQMPARVEGDVITYADLDLDVVKEPGAPPVLVDVEEFLDRSAAMGYPPEVMERAWDAAACLLRLLSTDQPPLH